MRLYKDRLVFKSLEGVWMTELVDESLGSFRFLHDALAVVLANGATEFVVVHRRPVLAFAPQFGHTHAVLDLKDAPLAVEPTNG